MFANLQFGGAEIIFAHTLLPSIRNIITAPGNGGKKQGGGASGVT
jgi:hypothetical protein